QQAGTAHRTSGVSPGQPIPPAQRTIQAATPNPATHRTGRGASTDGITRAVGDRPRDGAPVSGGLLQRDQPDGWVKLTQVIRVRGDDGLVSAARADDYVSIGDIGGPAGGQQPADVCRIHPVQAYDVGRGLADQPREPGLPVWSANGLRQCG